MTWRIDRIESGPIWLTANLTVWLLVVLFFSQSIALWHVLVGFYGKPVAGIVPVALAGLLVASLVGWAWWRYSRFALPWGVLSVAIFLAGLLSTDPAFPAKRVHIPEYFALTIVVYFGCRHHLSSALAIWGSVVLACGLGGIDEILQGAMATRTFGLRDIGTNGLGALSAGLFLRALPGRETSQPIYSATVIHGAILSLGLGLLLVGANAYKGAQMPGWIFLPALAALPLLTCDRGRQDIRFLDAMGALCALAILLLGGIGALEIDFR